MTPDVDLVLVRLYDEDLEIELQREDGENEVVNETTTESADGADDESDPGNETDESDGGNASETDTDASDG